MLIETLVKMPKYLKRLKKLRNLKMYKIKFWNFVFPYQKQTVFILLVFKHLTSKRYVI